MSRRSARTKRRSRLRGFLKREMKHLADGADSFSPGMTLGFVLRFGEWAGLHDRLKKVPRA